LDAVCEEAVNERGANKAGRAGDEDVIHAEVKVRVSVKGRVGRR
jgi:hypothetical protein